MRAIVTQVPGGFDHTQLTEAAAPTAGDAEVLVDIYAAALNPADVHLIEGRYPGGPNPPLVAGRDAAGVVVQADAAGRFPVGTRVLVLQSNGLNRAHGTLCERQRFPAESVAIVPDGWSWAEAAAAPLVYQTAWSALTRARMPGRGKVIAVIGAGGGVGLAAVQLGLARGATVVALSREEEKRARLRTLGAHYVFASDLPNLKDELRDTLGGRGIDCVVDTVGGPLLTTAVHLLGPHGHISELGVMAGVEGAIPIPSLMFKQASIHGILVSGLSPGEAATQWQQIVETLQQTGMRPIVARTFALESFPEAFCLLAGHPFGKVVLEMKRS